ncbi:MAG: 23S rRNA (adenine(2503)-C(2))-methyltransferase RlmN [Treponemataceae bacterium]
MPTLKLDNFEKLCLLGLLPEEIAVLIPSLKKFKSFEIFKNFSKGIFSFDEFTTLSLDERDFLAKSFYARSTKIIETKNDPDGTKKISLELFDKNIIETVLLVDKERKTACLSSQVGCPLACKFCKTGLIGFARNLFAGEIVEQFFLLEKNVGTIDNIVFMGMGEPLLNLANVKKAIQIFSHPKGRNFSKRRITISTAGVIEGIKSLGKILPEIRLAVSLTTANEDLRKTLMPIAKTNPLPELKKALQIFSQDTKRRISLELALMHNVNTGKQFSDEVIEFARPLKAHVNLIPWNKIPELDFESPSEKEIMFFEQNLKKAGINVTRRAKQGSDILGACGQLGKIIPENDN